MPYALTVVVIGDRLISLSDELVRGWNSSVRIRADQIIYLYGKSNMGLPKKVIPYNL